MNEGLARTGYGQENTNAALLPLINTGARPRTFWAQAANDNRLSLRRRIASRGAVVFAVGLLLALLAAL